MIGEIMKRLSITLKLRLLPIIACWFAAFAAFAQLPAQGGAGVAPDAWLFANRGPAWFYSIKPSPTPVMLKSREPTAAEKLVIERVQQLMANTPAKAFVLMDGDTVVYTQFNAPANAETMILGFSMGKTVTAMAVGKAICADKLKLETKASDLLPPLAGKALGNATIRDLLRMASGTDGVFPDSTIRTPEQNKAWDQGKLNLLELVSEDRIASAQKGIFSDYKPGESMNYKSTDPYVVAMMVSKAVGMPWSQWLQEQVLNPMGVASTGLQSQDRQGNAEAGGGIRLRIEDWMRFALWVKRSSKEQGCFGDFVRAALATQIRNGNSPADRKHGKLFAGYGYFTWTDNAIAANTTFASGWGGQRISWHRDSERMVVVFSGVENWMPELYNVTRDWNRVSN